MNSEQSTMKQVWQVEQEILDVIHQICSEHGLRYSLAYGTLLGAVRHGGFIPWDDDIDLMMPREDYNELCRIWNRVAPEGYLLVNGDTDSDYTNNFTKIVKDHTTFLQDESQREKHYPKGIFVDIFPGDRTAPGKMGRLFQYCVFTVNLLFSRGYTSGHTGLLGLGERVLLCIPKSLHKHIRKVTEQTGARWNGKADSPYVFASTISSSKIYYSKDIFNKMRTILFNGKEYAAVEDSDDVLRAEYGDYMRLPPEEDRIWMHHPIYVDFERNLEEISEAEAVSRR